MRLKKFSVRTLLIAVAVIAVLLEVVGLGRRSRHYSAQAQEAASAELINLQVARNCGLAASQSTAEADRLAATDPARSKALRERSEMLLRNIPFHEVQAKRAAAKRREHELAMMRPWEGDPLDAQGLAATPPAP